MDVLLTSLIDFNTFILPAKTQLSDRKRFDLDTVKESGSRTAELYSSALVQTFWP